MNKPAKLVLARHTEAKWNAMGWWQGWVNDDLSSEGIAEAKTAGSKITDLQFDHAYSSPLDRAERTLKEILQAIGQPDLPVVTNRALLERDYGIYTGRVKWEVEKEVGEEEFHKLRRAWDYPIPEGESMKQVYERVVPFYQQEILPKLEAGKNIIIASHGNTLRALVKFLDNLTEDEVAELEFGIGEIYVYDVDSSGKIVGKEIRNKNPLAGKQ